MKHPLNRAERLALMRAAQRIEAQLRWGQGRQVFRAAQERQRELYEASKLAHVATLTDSFIY